MTEYRFDKPLILQVNLPMVDTIHSKGNKIVVGVKVKAAGDLKHNNSPDHFRDNLLSSNWNTIPNFKEYFDYEAKRI